ncbi:hypothetical protein L6R29_18805 [Myxococcota bacterium]|nr:hypothetical protein [Myxococcota bacterium]
MSTPMQTVKHAAYAGRWSVEERASGEALTGMGRIEIEHCSEQASRIVVMA